MAIGDVRASGGLQTQLVNDNSGQINAQATSGLGEAVQRLADSSLGYLRSRDDIANVYDNRAQASAQLDTDTRFLEFQTKRGSDFETFARERSSTPMGMTKDYDAMLGAEEEAFLKTVPPRQREETAAKMARDRAQRVGAAFSSELSLLDTADTNNLNTSLNTLGSSLKGGKVSLEDAEAEFAEIVTKSGLPEETKQEFIERGAATLQGLEFGTQVEQTANGLGAVGDGSDASDVVAANLQPAERGILNGIAAEESTGYNIWNGGTSFQGYADHPGANGTYPGESSAAGRYQFIIGTWRLATAHYQRVTGTKVPNFEPEWQDRVALKWAEKRFNELNGQGLTFQGVLASGDAQQLLIMKSVLGDPRGGNKNAVEWQGLGPMDDAKFLALMSVTEGTGTAEGPNVWTDPKYSALSLDAKLSFANQAKSAATQFQQQQVTQQNLEQSNFLDTVYQAGYTGDPRAADGLRGSQYWNAEAEAKFTSGMNVFRDSEKGVADVGSALSSGAPLTQAQQKNFGKWMGESTFEGVANGDAQAMEKMRWAVDRAKIFPEGSADAFKRAMGNPSTAMGALDFLSRANMGDSSILKRSGWTNEDIADVQLFQNLAENEATPEAAFAAYNELKQVAETSGKTPTQLGNEASELFTEAYPTAADVVDIFNPYLGENPNVSLDENISGQVMQEASAAYSLGFRRYGTAEGAEAYMQTVLANTFGVSQTNRMREGVVGMAAPSVAQDPVLMRNPPEKHYPAHNGNYDYIYAKIGRYAKEQGAQQDNAVLRSDDQTDKDIRAGKPPTYKVIGMDEFGGAVVLPGRFGGQGLVEEGQRAAEENMSQENAMSAIEAATQQLASTTQKLVLGSRYNQDPAQAALLQAQVDAETIEVQKAIQTATSLGYMDDPKAEE